MKDKTWDFPSNHPPLQTKQRHRKEKTIKDSPKFVSSCQGENPNSQKLTKEKENKHKGRGNPTSINNFIRLEFFSFALNIEPLSDKFLRPGELQTIKAETKKCQLGGMQKKEFLKITISKKWKQKGKKNKHK